jgi:hypothetical protein
MKSRTILIAAVLGTLCACKGANADTEVTEHDGPWAADLIANASMNNAIVTQHTLYPYHFVAGTAQLNDLGQRDLSVLMDHFLKAGGDLNVHRGSAPQPLYDARVKTVLEGLAAAGVASGAVAIKDGLPGGEGLSSERVIVILKEKMSKTEEAGSGSSSSTTSSSTSSGTSLQ